MPVRALTLRRARPLRCGVRRVLVGVHALHLFATAFPCVPLGCSGGGGGLLSCFQYGSPLLAACGYFVSPSMRVGGGWRSPVCFVAAGVTGLFTAYRHRRCYTALAQVSAVNVTAACAAASCSTFVHVHRRESLYAHTSFSVPVAQLRALTSSPGSMVGVLMIPCWTLPWNWSNVPRYFPHTWPSPGF